MADDSSDVGSDRGTPNKTDQSGRKYALRGSSTKPLRYRKEIGEADEDIDEHTLTTPNKNTPGSKKKITPSSAKKFKTKSGQKEMYKDDESGMFDSEELNEVTSARSSWGNQMQKSSGRVSSMPRQIDRPALYTRDMLADQASSLPAGMGMEDSAESSSTLTYPAQTGPSAMYHTTGHYQAAAAAPVALPNMTTSLRENLRRLKNLLKLPNARKWVFSEFFYSEIDQQLFFGDNEFDQCLYETMPNLRCRRMTKPQWRQIRSLIGKPRRCSQAFFEEERVALEQRRQRIRQLYSGLIVVDVSESSIMECLDPDQLDLPRMVPPPLTVGNKVFTRVTVPDDTRRDGAFVGTVDAIIDHGFRIVFDKDELLEPRFVSDTDVMREHIEELVPLSYFVRKNRANLPHAPFAGNLLPSASTSPVKKQGFRMEDGQPKFPIKLLVHVVKLRKILDLKRKYVKQVTDMNTTAEKINLHSGKMDDHFQQKYAEVLLDLENVNKTMADHLKYIYELQQGLWPQVTSSTNQVRSDIIRKQCQIPAAQIVKHCNNGLNVRSQTALKLISSLTALLLQVRAMGTSNCAPMELKGLSEALADIRMHIQPNNSAAFQDHVEVHMKQIHNLMLQSASQQQKFSAY